MYHRLTLWWGEMNLIGQFFLVGSPGKQCTVKGGSQKKISRHTAEVSCSLVSNSETRASAFPIIVREPNSEYCLDLIFAAPPCENVIIVPDTNHITAIRKFMLDMPTTGIFQNIGILVWVEHGSEHVKPSDSIWVKIKGVQLKINLQCPIAC